MRIAFVTNNYRPYAGGVVSSIDATVTALRARGHDVFVVTLSFLDSHTDDPEYVRRISCPLKFTYKSMYIAVPWRPERAVQEALEMLCPDIIHVHHPFFLGQYAAHFGRKRRIPVVFTYHTIYEEYAHYVPGPHAMMQRTIKKMVLSFCKDVDGIIAPSSYIQQYLCDHGIAVPITVIPSGLLPVFWWSEHKPIAARNTIELVTVSRFAKEKNIYALLDMFAQIACDARFTLVGHGAEYDGLCTYAYRTLGLSPQTIRFVVSPPKEAIARYYRCADLFVFASITETQGLVVAEAMAAGTPVIALDGPGQRDSVQPGKNGFLVTSVDDMAQAIRAVASDRVHLERLSRGAFESAQHYRPESLAHQLEQSYSSL